MSRLRIVAAVGVAMLASACMVQGEAPGSIGRDRPPPSTPGLSLTSD